MFSAPAKRGRGTARRAVEGASDSKLLRRQSNDGISRFINAVHQFGRGNTNYCHAMFLQPSIAAFVALRSIGSYHGLCRQSRSLVLLSRNRSRARMARSDVGDGIPAFPACAGAVGSIIGPRAQTFCGVERRALADNFFRRSHGRVLRGPHHRAARGPPPPFSWGRKICHAALRSRSAFHWPRAASPFIMARWSKARCAAAMFSGFARPGGLRRMLQRAAVGESHAATAAGPSCSWRRDGRSRPRRTGRRTGRRCRARPPARRP